MIRSIVISAADVLASNGIIDSMDAVVVPPRIDVGACLSSTNVKW